MTRVALARLLVASDIECRTYPSALAFLAALPSARPAWLVVDVDIPEMTGFDLQRELLRLGFRIPTIVTSALGDARLAAGSISLGAAAFLHKPLTGERLMAAVKSAARSEN